VDLSAWSGRDLTIRFRFGADAWVVEEGWYIDDVRLTEPLKTNGWFSISPTGGVVAVSAGTNLTLSLSAAALPSGTDIAAFVEMIGNDPFIATNRIPVALRVRSEPVGSLDFAAQTSTNGEGLVTVTQTVADADGELCSMSLEYSVDGGGTWTNVRVLSATSTPAGVQFTNAGPFQLLGALTRTNGILATNRIQVVWDTRNSPLPVTLCADTRLRARIWDGIFWDVSDITSAPFLVDNEAPSLPTGLAGTSHVVQTWSANPLLHASWEPSSDGSGIGVAGYLCGITTNLPLVSFSQFSGQTQTVLSAAGESTNWWFCVEARDAFGNTGGVAAIGPFWIDTLPPSAVGALVSVLRSPAGNYIVGDGTVTSLWSGFTDRGIGVAGYYCALTNSAGTTNGIWTAGATAVLTGAQLDRTNTVFVWAQDQLGWIGSAAAATVLVLRAESDWDRDGLANGAEETAGTDAADGQSVFRADSISTDTNSSGFVIRWNSIAGRSYALYSTNCIDQAGPWAPIATNLTGTGGTMEYTDTNAVAPTLYYRITVRLP
jgi:hypothetical protein